MTRPDSPSFPLGPASTTARPPQRGFNTAVAAALRATRRRPWPGIKQLLAAPVLAILALLLLACSADMAEAKAKSIPPRERTTLLMAQGAVGGQSFSSVAEEKRAIVEAGNRILDEQQRELDEMFAEGKRTALEHALISDRIEKSRAELDERAQRMLRPGGPVNAIKRGYAKCREGVVWLCSQPFRLITPEESAMKIATVLVTGAELKSRAGRAITGGISELAATEKFLKTSLDEIARLVRELERNPRLSAPERATQLLTTCLRACDDMHASCQHRNCRAHPKDAACLRRCASCTAGMCEQAFDQEWAKVDRGYLSCSARQAARYLTGLQGCVDTFIKDKGKDRVKDEALCAESLREGFVAGRDGCRDTSCSKNCDRFYTIYQGTCLCVE